MHHIEALKWASKRKLYFTRNIGQQWFCKEQYLENYFVPLLHGFYAVHAVFVAGLRVRHAMTKVGVVAGNLVNYIRQGIQTNGATVR